MLGVVRIPRERNTLQRAVPAPPRQTHAAGGRSMNLSSTVAVRAVSRVPVSDGLDETQDSHAALAARKLVESLQEAQRVRVGKERARVQVGIRTTRHRAAVE